MQGDVYPGDRVVVKGGHELSSLFFLGILKLSDEDRKRLGIVPTIATYRPIATAIELAATVTLPPENRFIASSQLAGTIHSHTLSPGKEIRAGELLMEIASPEFYALQLDLLRTSLDANLSRLRARRLEQLSGEAVSRRVLLETLSQADQLEGRVESLKQQLISVGLSDSEVDLIINNKKIYDFLPVRSQIDGRLITWAGTLGETVVANQALAEIQNLSSFWIEAYVPPELIASIPEDSHGQASVLANPEIYFPVTVSRIGPVVSETTRNQLIWLTPEKGAGPTGVDLQETRSGSRVGFRRTAKQTETVGEFPYVKSEPFGEGSNPFPIRDRMQLTVAIKTAEGQTGLVIPVTAVLRDGLHTFVFVQKPDDYVERRRVTIGRSDGEFIEVINGIIAGEAVVSTGGRELQTAFASLR